MEAKEVITEGLVKVNGEVDTRRGKNYKTATLYLTEKRSRLKNRAGTGMIIKSLKLKRLQKL